MNRVAGKNRIEPRLNIAILCPEHKKNSEGEMAKTRGKSVTDGTEKKLRNLKPFKPGQSGNPKGRPKGARNRLGTQFLEALEKPTSINSDPRPSLS